MLNKRTRNWQNSSAAYWSIQILFTAAGGTWLFFSGPFPAVRGAVALDIEAPFSFSYMLSAFLFLGMLVAEPAAIAANGPLRRGLGLMTALSLLVGISFFIIALALVS